MRELDIVTLKVDLPQHGLKKGDRGTIVHLHDEKGIEVEFLGGNDSFASTFVSLSPSDVIIHHTGTKLWPKRDD